jgi:hypothetical protein
MDAEPCGTVLGIFLLVEGSGKSAIGYMTPGEPAIREARRAHVVMVLKEWIDCDARSKPGMT